MENFHIVRETHSAPTDNEAKKAVVNSRNTLAIAAASASGVKIHEYTRLIEDSANGPQTVASFALEEGFFEFRPDFAAENISTGELLRRLRDEEWQRANPHHPIAYMAQAIESYKRLTRAIRTAAPLLRIPRGRGYLLLNMRGDREHQRRLMRRAGVTESEMEQIIAQMEAAR